MSSSRSDGPPAQVSDDLGPDPTSQALLRLVPKIGPVVATWRQETFERQQKRAEKLGSAASEGIGAEQFFRQVAADERLTDMFNAAVEQAVATSSDAKIRLLAKALAAGVTGEDLAAVDTAEQLLRIAMALEPVDIRALRALERWRGVDAVHLVAHALRVDEAIAGPITARLQALHLVKVETVAQVNNPADRGDDSVHVTEEWTVTATAHALMDLLHSRGAEADPKAVRPDGAEWAGHTVEQAHAFEALVELCTYDWRRDPQPGGAVSQALRRLSVLGVDRSGVQDAMRSIGFRERDLRDLARWQSLGQ